MAFKPAKAVTLTTWKSTRPTIRTTSKGVVGAAAVSGNRLKMQIRLDGQTYSYDMPNDGTGAWFPLNLGSGTYTYRIMENVEGNRYAELLSTRQAVSLPTGLEPFLAPSAMCWFQPDDALVSKAKSLVAGASSETAAASAIYRWVIGSISYDTAKAKRLSGGKGYVPSPAETYAKRTGICFDYAALMAAMLRGVGIPAKVVTGSIDRDLYHSWVLLYTDGKWRRADPTLATARQTSKTYKVRFTY